MYLIHCTQFVLFVLIAKPILFYSMMIMMIMMMMMIMCIVDAYLQQLALL